MSRSVRKTPLVRCAWCGRWTRVGASKRRAGKVWCGEWCGWRQAVRGRARTDGKWSIKSANRRGNGVSK